MREGGKGVTPRSDAPAALLGFSFRRIVLNSILRALDADVRKIRFNGQTCPHIFWKFPTVFALPLVSLIVVIAVAGCLGNPANVRTFASAVQTVTGDTPGIVAADQASCEANAALQREYDQLEGQELSQLPCEQLSGVLKALIAENTAIEAYAKALSDMAQDQFVTTDTDAKSVTTTLQNSGAVSSPVVAAVGSIFSLVEEAALKEYRQKELSKAMTGEPADAFKTIMASYSQLAIQYSNALDTQLSDLETIKAAIAHDHQKAEPVAVAEMFVRLEALHQDIQAKATAIKAFTGAIDKANAAFDSAARDLTNPNPKDIYDSVSAFASQVNDAHDKLKKAFGGP